MCGRALRWKASGCGALRGKAGGAPAGISLRLRRGGAAYRPTGPVRFQRTKPDAWAPLFSDAAGDVVGIRRLGRGTLIAVADPGLFSNARIETVDHARLILNIVRAHAGRGQVLVTSSTTATASRTASPPT